MPINLGSILPSNVNLNKISVIDLGDKPSFYTYSQINDLCNAVARGLSLHNIKPRDKICILSNNSVRMVATFFGAMRLGAVPILINPHYKQHQIDNILSKTQSQILFTDQNYVYNCKTINFNDQFSDFLNFGNHEPYTPKEDDIAFIIYSSGTTADPKEICIDHESHLWGLMNQITKDKLSSKRISLISTPLSHSNGLTTFEGSFLGGATIVLMPKFAAKDCLEAIEKYKINTLFCVPSMLSLMIKTTDIDSYNLKSIKLIRSASSHLSSKLCNSVKKYFIDANIINNYGITEVGFSLFGSHPDGIPRPGNSVGYPIDGIDYKIVNGILYIKSPGMTKKYQNTDTNKRFSEDGYFITNDKFYVDTNGFYYFDGRDDDAFKCSGYLVYPSQLEEILENHQAVLSAAVIAVEDQTKGYKPYAFAILDKNAEVNEEELKQYVIERVPTYMHPRRIFFIDNFPLSASNKIDKKALQNLCEKLL